MGEPIVVISEIYAGYGSGDVLQGVNLTIGKGEIVATIGRNGVGKSTLMKALIGIIDVRKGSISFEDTDITIRSPKWRARKGIGFVPQGREIFPELSVEENLLTGEQVGMARAKRKLRYELVYEYFPILKERRRQRGGTLSGGQQQMLAIGRALVGNPELLLLDEPSVGIQPTIIQQIGRSLLMLNHEEGLTIFLVEQNISLIENVVQRAYAMDKGRIVSVLDGEQVKDRDLLTQYLAM
ncbi:MAG: ABC transporter ATP-binding protein [Desulfobacterales bacterium]|nr:ABC transporter ATP-binding protein [Desulfobacterales bacterium]